MENNFDVNKPYVITVQLYEELHKYKDLFPYAILYYHDNYIAKRSYISPNKKKTIRLKITTSHKLFIPMIFNIEKWELEIINQVLKNDKLHKISQSTLINNILGLYVIRAGY